MTDTTPPGVGAESAEPPQGDTALRERLVRALARTVYRDDNPPPHIARICQPWADEIARDMQAWAAEQTQRAEQAVTDLAEHQAELRRSLAEVIDLMECRPARMIHDAVWARVRPALHELVAQTSEQRQRAEQAERKLREMTTARDVLAELTKRAEDDLAKVERERDEARAALREFVSDTPCDPHPGNGFCQTHGERKPCPHAAAKRLLDRPEGT